jgi:hypothetical protein
VFTIDGAPDLGASDWLPCGESDCTDAQNAIGEMKAVFIDLARSDPSKANSFRGDVTAILTQLGQINVWNAMRCCQMKQLGEQAQALTALMGSRIPPKLNTASSWMSVVKWALGLGLVGALIWGGVNVYRTQKGMPLRGSRRRRLSARRHA